MALVEEGPLADLRALEAGVHVIDRGSPAVDLRGSQRGILRFLGLVFLCRFFEPAALALGLLLVTALILLVALDLVVDERNRFAGLRDRVLSRHLHVRLVQVHVRVLLLQLFLKPFDVLLRLRLGDLCLLLEHLTVGRNLNGIVQLHRLANFPHF